MWFDCDAAVIMSPFVTPSHKQSIVRPEWTACLGACIRACVLGMVGGICFRRPVFLKSSVALKTYLCSSHRVDDDDDNDNDNDDNHDDQWHYRQSRVVCLDRQTTQN